MRTHKSHIINKNKLFTHINKNKTIYSYLYEWLNINIAYFHIISVNNICYVFNEDKWFDSFFRMNYFFKTERTHKNTQELSKEVTFEEYRIKPTQVCSIALFSRQEQLKIHFKNRYINKLILNVRLKTGKLN